MLIQDSKSISLKGTIRKEEWMPTIAPHCSQAFFSASYQWELMPLPRSSPSFSFLSPVAFSLPSSSSNSQLRTSWQKCEQKSLPKFDSSWSQCENKTLMKSRASLFEELWVPSGESLGTFEGTAYKSLLRKIIGDREASLVAQMVKNLPAMQETQVRSLSQEDPLEKGMVTHPSILAWRIPWTLVLCYSPWGHKVLRLNFSPCPYPLCELGGRNEISELLFVWLYFKK